MGVTAMRRVKTKPKAGAMQRRLVAFFAHAPGLWLCYRERLPAHLLRHNLGAVLCTLLAMSAPLFIPALSEKKLGFAASAWLIGHFAWGAYLAARLPESSSRLSACSEKAKR